MRVGIAQDTLFRKHENGPGHPEQPVRLDAVEGAVRVFAAGGEEGRVLELPMRDAGRAELELVHDSRYLDLLEETALRDRTVFDADTQANSESFNVARRAAGAAAGATSAAASGLAKRSFVCSRPPGHHAERNRAMGFCLLNNASVAAAVAIAAHGMDRVAIVDWDVHHGNGTQHIFDERRDVLYLSLHQYPHYPGTGSVSEVGIGDGEGFTVNVPLPAGSGNDDYAHAMRRIILPVLHEFAPELIIVSAGFDAHRLDPLAGMMLDGSAYRNLTLVLREVADRFCESRIVHILEGGYDSIGLSEGVGSVLNVLGDDTGDDGASASSERPAEQVEAVVEAARSLHARYWRALRES